MANTLILNIANNPAEVNASIGGGGGSTADCVKKSDIVDNLLTADVTKPLSANQGRELKSQLDILKADVSKIIVEGVGVKAGRGISVTTAGGESTVALKIDTDSNLAFNEDNELTMRWLEE